jgi:hypothetical protein
VGRHSFQQSANVRLTGRIGTIDATVNEIKAVNPGLFKSLTGDSGVSQGSKPLSVPYSPFTSDRGRPKITSGQGWRWGREHKGIDVEADPGTPMYAYLPGTIVFSGDAGGYGYRVEWKDSKGFIHSYSHMQKDPGFRVGQKVNQGQLMGYVGNTGRSTGPHLHWEIQNSSGTHQDVIGWLKSNPLPKPKPETTQPNQPNQPNQPKKTPSFSRLTSKEAQELEMRSVFMKPGDPPIVVEGIGSIQMGKDFFGRPQKKYYNRDGKEITKDQFNELMKKYKNPIRSNTPKKKYGGLVYKPGTSPVLPEEKYASYEDPMERGIVAIQPIYISQPVPVPVGGSGGGGVIAFSLPKVNNMDNYQQLMRG